MTEQNSKNNQVTLVEVNTSDLPLSCPRQQAEVWNMHPRVYLDIQQKGEVSCPYCGIHYVLKAN